MPNQYPLFVNNYLSFLSIRKKHVEKSFLSIITKCISLDLDLTFLFYIHYYTRRFVGWRRQLRLRLKSIERKIKNTAHI